MQVLRGTSRARRFALLLTIVAGVVAPRAGRADQAIVGEDERMREALAHYERGKAAFENGDFVASALEFEQAASAFGPIAAEGGADATRASSFQRAALSNAATGWSRADRPVEAHDAFTQVRGRFADVLGKDRLDEIDQALAKLADRIGKLVIRGVPNGTELRIDGVLIAPTAYAAPLRVASGRHDLEVRGPEYKTWDRAVTVAPRASVDVDVRLETSEEVGRLRVEAAVTPAKLTLDGKDAGTLPVNMVVKPGAHKYTVSSEGYRDEEGEVDVAPGGKSTLRVSMIPKRQPIGLRFEPAFMFTIALRGDTPFNNWVDRGERYDEGYGLALGGGFRTFYTFDRMRSIHVGVLFDFIDRPLNKGLFGPTFEWCPSATSTSYGAAWCPVTLSFLLAAIPGRVDRFSGGDYSTRLGTKLERRIGLLYFSFSAGLASEAYKRNALHSLVLGTAWISIGIGVDL